MSARPAPRHETLRLAVSTEDIALDAIAIASRPDAATN
jgi:hypothetical protein